ncbi:tripartite motif-containing protein 16-like [Brachionichthys hirsutus]|uniref:tripartite motif-containing protein 16-like n=1 Tax=Brachionichthys hirsutus TaxID=412623 RepID=UPI003604F00D
MATLGRNTEENVEESQHSSNLKEKPRDVLSDLSETLLCPAVLCDSCIDGPSKALKSCLTCLVSYCQAHLRPHLENSKFQNHRLVDPRHDVDCQPCEAHQLPLERFCLRDGCCVCRDCESLEHNGHATASVGEARIRIETELQGKREEIRHRSSAAEEAIEKLQSNNNVIKSSVQEICVIVEQQFARLHTSVEEARKVTMQSLEVEQGMALKQAESIRAHLEQRKTELAKAMAQINKVFKSKSDADFLLEYSEWKRGATDACLPAACTNHTGHLASYVRVVTDTTRELCDRILSSFRDRLDLVLKSGTKSLVPEFHPSSLPDPETREDFLTYTRRLTFDPDTTHPFLRVMEDSRKLTNTSPWRHSYPDHPDRFEYWRQAVTVESLYQGRHYNEAELKGDGAHIGVTYRSIDRKAEHGTSCITGSDVSWCVGSNSRGFFAWHAGEETPLEAADVTKVGLYVDFHRCSVSFYDVSGAMRLLHKYTAHFSEPLHVAAWLSKKDNTVLLLRHTK